MTSEARPPEDDAVASSGHGEAGESPVAGSPGAGETTTDGPENRTPDAGSPEGSGKKVRRGRRGSDEDGNARSGGRLSIPLVPTLLVLLLLLLGGVGYLWLTRPEASAVRTANYVEVLQAARSGIVDFTSFDHLTLDDDIEQMRRVATGDLREEGVAELDGRRDQIIAAEAVVNTEVIGAGVTRATESSGTVLLVIQSTQQSNASEQAQVVRYRVEVELEKADGRWLLSGIKGTGTGDE